MFDIGFLEVFLVLIIALLVIGPERMPEVARKIGRLTWRIRRFVQSVKQDTQIQGTLKDFKESVNFEEQQQQINQIHNQLQSGLDFNQDLKLDELQRPNFGNENQVETSPRSQFNTPPITPQKPNPPEAKPKVPETTEALKMPETLPESNKS